MDTLRERANLAKLSIRDLSDLAEEARIEIILRTGHDAEWFEQQVAKLFSQLIKTDYYWGRVYFPTPNEAVANELAQILAEPDRRRVMFSWPRISLKLDPTGGL